MMATLSMATAAAAAAAAAAVAAAAPEFDVVVYGASCAGVAAAVAAGQLGMKVGLYEPLPMIGGMCAAGNLALHDSGPAGGLGEVYARLNAEYYNVTKPVSQPESFVSVRSFDIMLKNASVTHIKLDCHLTAAAREVSAGGSSKVKSISVACEPEPVTATVFIDASYDGEIMVAAGDVEYVAGRESVAHYNESLAGARQPGWNGVGGPRDINPLKDDGTLIKYVSNLTELAAPGEADDALMAFQHRLCVSGDPTDVPWGRVPWPKPPNYDPDDFLIMQRAIEAGDSSPYQGMPPSMMRASASGACTKKKYTVCCGISVVASDQPMLNKGWANATWERKQEIIAEHTYFELGSLYYLANDPKVPVQIRDKFSKFGLCKDEFQDYGHVPPQLYIRISNRLVGSYVMTQNNMPPISSGEHPDSIATGSWSFDEHMTGKYAVPLGNGSYVTQLEGNFWPKAGPYDVPYGALIPKRGTGANLLVPVCLSASAVAYSSTRIETMFMATGTAAGVAAKQLVDGSVETVQDVNVTEVQAILTTRFDTPVHHGNGGGGGGSCPGNSSVPDCKSYTVSGAGTEAANGIYKFQGGFKYGMPLYQNKDGYQLYRYSSVWRLVIDGHLVYTGPHGCSPTPQSNGWSVCKPSSTQDCKLGKDPAPTIKCGVA